MGGLVLLAVMFGGKLLLALHVVEACGAVAMAVHVASEYREWRRWQTWSALRVLGGEAAVVFPSFTAYLEWRPVIEGDSKGE